MVTRGPGRGGRSAGSSRGGGWGWPSRGSVKRLLVDRSRQAEADREQRENEAQLLDLKQKQATRPSSAKKAARFIPNLAECYEQIVNDVQQALLVDVNRARNSLRASLGEVKMIPGKKFVELMAEAHIAGDALIRECLQGSQNIRLVAGACYGSKHVRYVTSLS